MPPSQEPSADLLFEDYSATALFVQSAKRARVGYSIEAGDYPAIAQICRQVDGIPLGLELAATWVRTLTCAEIAREIAGSLDFLSTRGWGALERHIASFALGAAAEAQACFVQALQLAAETQLMPCLLDSLAGVAMVYAGQGKAEEAVMGPIGRSQPIVSLTPRIRQQVEQDLVYIL